MIVKEKNIYGGRTNLPPHCIAENRQIRVNLNRPSLPNDALPTKESVGKLIVLYWGNFNTYISAGPQSVSWRRCSGAIQSQPPGSVLPVNLPHRKNPAGSRA